MDSIKELTEENRKYKIEIEILESRVKKLEQKLLDKEKIVLEAKNIIGLLPTEVSTRQFLSDFSESKKEILVEEYFDNVGINKIFSNTEKFTIDDNNNILLGNLHLGTSTDDRFKLFLIKTVKILPFLVKLYIRYGNFTQLVSKIDKYKYFGKAYFDRMEYK